MKKLYILGLITIFASQTLIAQEIWDGPTITFTKEGSVDWTLEENQDRITDEVWITRANTKGIFNIAQETEYDGMDLEGNSPLDTEWAFGTTAEVGSLNFSTWAILADGSPPDLVGEDLVVHLITEDIYIDLKFTEWGIGAASGGSFAYERSTQAATSTRDVNSPAVKVFPNPVVDEIMLEGLEVNQVVRIADVTGKIWLNLEARKGQAIQVSQLPAGQYFVLIQDRKAASFIKK
ncbi:MAG: T9SS type A sorting domain-containing protein [Bacteroidetes bacterium]|nr:T9SS type A sorting domain-containing protein [Bacteroidota bacterium]